jgi:hypothetical protein
MRRWVSDLSFWAKAVPMNVILGTVQDVRLTQGKSAGTKRCTSVKWGIRVASIAYPAG